LIFTRLFVPLYRLRRFEQSPTNGDAADSELCSPEHLRSARSQRGMMNMNWIILIFAGLCEVGFTYCLGRAKGMTGYEWWTWIGGFAVFYVLSAILLAKATQTLPIGTAYPVWTGIGAVGAVLVGSTHGRFRCCDRAQSGENGCCEDNLDRTAYMQA